MSIIGSRNPVYSASPPIHSGAVRVASIAASEQTEDAEAERSGKASVHIIMIVGAEAPCMKPAAAASTNMSGTFPASTMPITNTAAIHPNTE